MSELDCGYLHMAAGIDYREVLQAFSHIFNNLVRLREFLFTFYGKVAQNGHLKPQKEYKNPETYSMLDQIY